MQEVLVQCPICLCISVIKLCYDHICIKLACSGNGYYHYKMHIGRPFLNIGLHKGKEQHSKCERFKL